MKFNESKQREKRTQQYFISFYENLILTIFPYSNLDKDDFSLD